MKNTEYHHTILIVDDLEEEIFLIKEQIHLEIPEIKITGITDPTKALDTAIKENVDLVLLDIQMPELNGFEVAKKLKNNKKTNLLPLIFITAEYNRQDFIERGFDIGAIDYMEKPLDGKQLLNKIKLYLKIFDREKELRRSEALYRAVVEDQTELIFRYKKGGKITFLNNAVTNFLNKEKKEIIGKNIRDLIDLMYITNIDVNETEKKFRELSIDNNIFTFETISEKPNKSKHWIKWTNRKIYDDDNSFIEYQSVGMDITEIKLKEQQLKISEERFRELFNHMNSEVTIFEKSDTDNDFIYKDINKYVENSKNIKRDNIIGKSYKEVLPENRKGNFKELLNIVWKTGETQNFFLSSYNENDEIDYWKEGYIYKLPSGEIVSIKDDLTERKKMEEELLKSDIKHWFLLDSIDTPVVAIKNNFVISYCNEAYANMFEKSSLELRNKNLLELIPDLDNHPSYKAYDEVIKTKIQKEIEYKDNEKYYSEYVYKTPWGVISVIKDITDKKHSELEIKKLYFSIEQSPNSIILTDYKGKIEYVNQAFTKISCFNTDEIKDKTLENIYSNERYKDFLYKINKAIGMGLDFKYELKTVNNNNKPVWLSITLSPIKNEQNYITHYLIIMEDITSRKYFEEKIRRINEELENRVKIRTEELNILNNKLDNKNKQLDQRNKTIEYDLKLAQKVQQQIITKALPLNMSINYSTFYEPLDMVGGDFFDFIIRREGDIGILICDVSGHGSAAGFITAMLKIITSTSRRYAHVPSMFLKNVNYAVYNKIAENFVTAFYGVISADRKKFTYSNAGHTFPILYKNMDKKIIRLIAKGGVLGVSNDLNFEQKEIDLDKGDRLFLYTDGVTETINRNKESYGRKRLYKFLDENNNEDIYTLVSNLYEDIKKFRLDIKTDDMAFVGLEIK